MSTCSHFGATRCSSTCEIAFLKCVTVRRSESVRACVVRASSRALEVLVSKRIPKPKCVLFASTKKRPPGRNSAIARVAPRPATTSSQQSTAAAPAYFINQDPPRIISSIKIHQGSPPNDNYSLHGPVLYIVALYITVADS